MEQVKISTNGKVDALAAIARLSHRQAIVNLNGAQLNKQAREAAILAEQLAALGDGISYAQHRLRAQILARLETGDLWKHHPDHPESLERLAERKGVSKSEVSDLLFWEKIAFPYIESRLGLNSEETWKRLGKTRCRKLTAYLRVLLVPGHKSSPKVHAAVNEFVQKGRQERIMDAAIACAELARYEGVNEIDRSIAKALRQRKPFTQGQEEYLYRWYISASKDYDPTRAVALALLNTAQLMNTNDMEYKISPDSVPDLEIVARPSPEGTRYHVSFDAAQEQLSALRRRLPRGFKLAVLE